MKVDPITFAVIKSGLDSIADDMAYTVVRIARSEIVKDVMDFSAALCAADGQMVAQAKTIAQHLGAIPEAMEAVLAKYGDDLHDGDVVIMNDPYHGGMHLPDVFMFVPLFFAVAAVGAVLPNSTSGALAAYPQKAGSASALIGAFQLALGAVASSLVSLLGSGSAVPLASVMAGCGILAFLVTLAAARRAAEATGPTGKNRA